MHEISRRQYAVAAAIANIAKSSDAAVLDALCVRMTSLAGTGRMMKRPWQEQEARKILAIAERRLAELRARAALTPDTMYGAKLQNSPQTTAKTAISRLLAIKWLGAFWR
ncbi:hypothetical protein [Methylocystis sp. B8]|uniref:hypothetical protein n=1 Tax=Methylocystis sp. B8 TaxID=544938 RepID=UPI0010FEBA1D|nr:hypothetical protein [Methylocystis sp. B8]TLG79066.1 hypothetical protein FEV16_03320 [Methylocystis sp. B8]